MANGNGEDELAMEVEALSYTYPEIEIEMFEPSNSVGTEASPAAAAALRIDLRPRAARQAFVAAALRLMAPRGCPTASPRGIEPQGLGDAREAALLARLAAEAQDLIAGPCLGQLIELCQDLLSDANAPEGAQSWVTSWPDVELPRLQLLCGCMRWPRHPAGCPTTVVDA
jgi:hypothetical protein